MESITFNKLNSESFEKLVRSLALEKMGLAGQVFPMGPDAGRDFSFEGKIVSHEPQGWDGYLVLQAKFRKVTKGGGNDVDWLIGQLESELKKYKKTDSSYRKPKYYIIATNINLSGSDSGSGNNKKTGGLTKIEEYFKTWETDIGLSGVDIWSAEKIETLLSTSEGVRKSFSAWITPSDILNKLLEKLDIENRNLSHALTTSLLQGLKKDKNVRLKDAGCLSDDQIRSSQVFVDLPISHSENKNHTLLVGELIESSKGIFKPSLSPDDSTRANKIVVLGGPGQGKSTASLFLTQLFRGAFLKSYASVRLDASVRELINEINERSSAEGIDSELPNRYPFYISLPQYADKISEARLKLQSTPSIVKHIAEEIAAISDHDVTVSNIREWLREIPWIIVFDGLDEVPPSGERANIVQSINNFLTEAFSLDSDLFVVITSRPQGYNSDLNPEEWLHWKLGDLDEKTALKYSKLLTLAYYKDDLDRQKKIGRQLELAVRSETTKRLMTSPLQVTILHMIVDVGGGTPTSRWNLFNEYFEILKKREKSKSGPAQESFDKNLQLVGPIHQRAGLLLHSAAEQAGQATSHLDTSRFSTLIRKYLESEEFSDSEIKIRVAELCELSLHRLVLLSSREEGKISFDVRSLQEFMAASALTSSAPETIISRLEYLGGKSHWQHVITIAASRCFSDDSLHHTRLAITGIPRVLDDQKHYKLVGRGSQLSLNLFLDGIAQDHPKYRRQLALYALELLNQGVDALEFPLANLCDNHTEEVVFTEIVNKYITAHNESTKAAAWGLLFEMAYRGHRKAAHFVGTKWPASNVEIFDIVKYGVLPKDVSTLMKSVASAILSNSFTDIYTKHYDLIAVFNSMIRGQQERDKVAIEWLNFLSAYTPTSITASIMTNGAAVHHRFNSLSSLKKIDLSGITGYIHPEWIFLAACSEFSNSPSIKTMAECISLCKQSHFSESAIEVLSEYIPWPLAEIIENLRFLPSFVEQDILMGEYGDATDWKEAEKRLSSNGVTKQDYEYSFNLYAFDKNIASIGTPFTGSISRRPQGSTSQIEPSELLALFKLSNNAKHKEAIAKILRITVLSELLLRKLNDEQTWEIVLILIEFDKTALRIDQFCRLVKNHWSEESLEVISRLSSKIIYSISPQDRDAIKHLNIPMISAFLSINDKYKILLRLLCIYRVISSSSVPVDRTVLEKYSTDSDPDVCVFATTLLFLDFGLSETAYIDVISKALTEGLIARHCFGMLRLILTNGPLSPEAEISLCTTALTELCLLHPEFEYSFKSILNTKLDAEQSKLCEIDIWKALKLPEDAYG